MRYLWFPSLLTGWLACGLEPAPAAFTPAPSTDTPPQVAPSSEPAGAHEAQALFDATLALEESLGEGSAPGPEGVEPRAGLTPVERLGKLLFFDRRLSEPPGQACAVCHAPSSGWTGPDLFINATGSVYEGAVQGRFGNRKPPSSAYATQAPILHFDEFRRRDLRGRQLLGWPRHRRGAGQPRRRSGPGALPQPGGAEQPQRGRRGGQGLPRRLRRALSLRLRPPRLRGCGERLRRHRAGRSRPTRRSPRSTPSPPSTTRGWPARPGSTSQERWGLELFETQGPLRQLPPEPARSEGRAAALHRLHLRQPGRAPEPAQPLVLAVRVQPGRGPSGWTWPGRLPVHAARSGGASRARTWASRRCPPCATWTSGPCPGFVKAYGHNGYFKSLEAIVHFYNTRDVLPLCLPELPGTPGVDCWPPPEVGLNVNATELGNLGLTPQEEAAIVAFLRTLSDGYFQR